MRNVYAYYGDRTSEFSNGLPRNEETARQFFDQGLRVAWMSPGKQPYDFLSRAPTWQIGAVAISILRRQYDKTYVAVAFTNQGRAVTLNFILVDGPEGWVMTDVESPQMPCGCFSPSTGNRGAGSRDFISDQPDVALSVAPHDIDGLLFAVTSGNRYGLRGAARHIGPIGRRDIRRISMCPIPGNIVRVGVMRIA